MRNFFMLATQCLFKDNMWGLPTMSNRRDEKKDQKENRQHFLTALMYYQMLRNDMIKEMNEAVRKINIMR